MFLPSLPDFCLQYPSRLREVCGQLKYARRSRVKTYRFPFPISGGIFPKKTEHLSTSAFYSRNGGIYLFGMTFSKEDDLE